MAGGSCRTFSELPADARRILDEARRAVLTTVSPGGSPHAVPVCFALVHDEIVTPIDAKPKSGKTLGRRRNIEHDPRVALLADRWDEEWRRLGWVMVRGTARFAASGSADEALVARYPQYRDLMLGSEAIVVTPERLSWWLWE